MRKNYPRPGRIAPTRDYARLAAALLALLQCGWLRVRAATALDDRSTLHDDAALDGLRLLRQDSERFDRARVARWRRDADADRVSCANADATRFGALWTCVGVCNSNRAEIVVVCEECGEVRRGS